MNKQKNYFSFFLAAAPWLRCQGAWRLGGEYFFFFFFFLLTTGCATAPHNNLPSEDQKSTKLLSQAASQFAAPNPPKAMNLMDEAQAEWKGDKSMKITVHQIWAARLKPDHPLPLLASLNQESENLSIQTLQLYDLDEKGNFAKSPTKAEIQWEPPAPNLPQSLSKIISARLPELNSGQALEIKYTLETKTSSLLKDKDTHNDSQKIHPVATDGSFAFRWNDYVPALKRELTINIPKPVALYATRLRIPKNLIIVEEKNSDSKTVHFSIGGPQDPLPSESFQPSLQDLAPLTAFTLYKSWDETVLQYRKRVKQVLDGDLGPVDQLLGDAEGNTSMALADRLAQVKNAIHQKVDWVDTGLPIYLNPDRPLQEVIESGKGTSHDMALLFATALKSMKIPSQIYLYRQSTSGELLNDMPALSQFDGVLVGVPSGKEMIWMDPTEPLAAPGILPLSALGQQALGVMAPVSWKITSAFGAKDHRKERDVTMEFSPNGQLKCSVDMLAFGSSELALRQFFRLTNDEKRRELVLKGLTKRFPGVSLTDYRFGDYRDISKPLDVHYTFEIPNYGKFLPKGGFLFYPLVFEDVEDFFAVLRDSRQTPVVIPQNFNSVTRVVVKLPPGYQVKELPKDGSISNPIAEFFSKAKLEFGTLTFERYLGLKQRMIYPGKEYTELLNFYQTVLSQDRTPFTAEKGK